MNKKLQALTVALFLTVLFSFAVSFWLLPDKTFSEEENRGLAPFPKFSWDNLVSGKFGDGMNRYFADQFPLRDLLVGLKGYCELALGKGENNGVVLGRNGQLQTQLYDTVTADGRVLEGTDGYDPAHVQKAIDGILRANEALDIPFSVLLAGRVGDVTAADSGYPSVFRSSLYARLHLGLDGKADYIDTVPMMKKMHERGESVYYRTDHHWTTAGAYYAYLQVLRSFGMEVDAIPREAFSVTAVDGFYGTAWSAGGMKFVEPDTLELWRCGNEADFLVTADGRLLDAVYSEKYLSTKDKYSVFLDGTHDIVTIEKPGEARPTLLLLKDSFANSLAPFLMQHFDLVIVNLSSRTDYTHLSALCAQYEADYALIVYGVESLLTADKLSKLR